MAENLIIDVELRDSFGRGANRRLRRIEDKVPGVVYGAEAEPVSVCLEQRVLTVAMQEEAFFSQILDLRLGDKTQQVVVRDLQRHPGSNKVLHVDFYRISENKPIQVSVPIHFLNEANCVGVRSQGGLVSHNLTEVEISCLPRDLPEFIEVDLEHIEVGQTIHLSDLQLSEGVEILSLSLGEDRDIPVVGVHMPKGGLDELEEEEEEEGLEIEDETEIEDEVTE